MRLPSAVNALLSAKQADCEEHGIRFEVSIHSTWESIPLPGWELCRILGNLIDNAADAIQEAATPDPAIRIAIGEDIRSWTLSVENNGPEIPQEHRAQIFQAGFTTKSEGHGNGLNIVRSLLSSYGGEIRVESGHAHTSFSCMVPKCSTIHESPDI